VDSQHPLNARRPQRWLCRWPHSKVAGGSFTESRMRENFTYGSTRAQNQSRDGLLERDTRPKAEKRPVGSHDLYATTNLTLGWMRFHKGLDYRKIARDMLQSSNRDCLRGEILFFVPDLDKRNVAAYIPWSFNHWLLAVLLAVGQSAGRQKCPTQNRISDSESTAGS
jgi:hypothetical protein